MFDILLFNNNHDSFEFHYLVDFISNDVDLPNTLLAYKKDISPGFTLVKNYYFNKSFIKSIFDDERGVYIDV